MPLPNLKKTIKKTRNLRDLVCWVPSKLQFAEERNSSFFLNDKIKCANPYLRGPRRNPFVRFLVWLKSWINYLNASSILTHFLSFLILRHHRLVEKLAVRNRPILINLYTKREKRRLIQSLVSKLTKGYFYPLSARETSQLYKLNSHDQHRPCNWLHSLEIKRKKTIKIIHKTYGNFVLQQCHYLYRA